MSRLFFAAASLALFATFGCQDESSSEDASAEESACSHAAAANCAKQDECRAELATKLFGSRANCEQRYREQCLASLGAPSAASSPESVDECAAANDAASCAEYRAAGPLDACLPVPGEREDGTACALNSECLSGYCRTPLGSACGSCAALPVAGDTCADTGDCGPTSLYCHPDSSTCQVYATAGEACSREVRCAPGSSCVGPMPAMAGTCVANTEEPGAACSRDQGPPCERALDLYCDETAGTCATAMEVAEGEACGTIERVLYRCAAGLLCFAPEGGAGTCQAPAADGAACDVTNGPPCLQPARCTATATGYACAFADAAACAP